MKSQDLIEIILDQKDELKHYSSSKKIISRKEEQLVNLDSNKAQVVIGVRRSGKSHLCHNVLRKSDKKYAYVNFDDERFFSFKAEDFNELLRCLYQVYGEFTHLFLDEAQNIESWHLFVNRLLRQDMKVIITGSNSKLLSSELSTHLTGRYHEIKLLPFSFEEFCRMKKVDTTDYSTKGDALLRRAFDEYLHTGGFPEIVNGSEDADEYIDTLVNNILDRDIIQRFKVRYKDSFRKVAHHLMNNAPCKIVNTSLQSLFDFKNSHTIENYVGYLYQAYLLIQLKKFSMKSSERVRNSKCYTVDVALLNARKDTFAKENFGRCLETLVLQELMRQYPTTYDIYYLSENSYEVDFVVCHRSTVVELVQVSYDIDNPKTYNREVNGLLNASKATQCDKLTLITPYEQRDVEFDGKTIHIRPCYKWMLSGDK